MLATIKPFLVLLKCSTLTLPIPSTAFIKGKANGDLEAGYFLNGGAYAEYFRLIKCTTSGSCEKIGRDAMAETCANAEVGGISLEGVLYRCSKRFCP